MNFKKLLMKLQGSLKILKKIKYLMMKIKFAEIKKKIKEQD